MAAPMCSDLSAPLCDYLLAKLILFCIFGGWAALYALTADPSPRADVLGRLCFTAVAFEAVALLVALFYVVGAVVIVVEAASSALLCACCCLTIPLLTRAEARGVARGPDMSIVLLAIACAECWHLTTASHHGVRSDGGAEEADDAKAASMIVAAARAGINMV